MMRRIRCSYIQQHNKRVNSIVTGHFDVDLVSPYGGGRANRIQGYSLPLLDKVILVTRTKTLGCCLFVRLSLELDDDAHETSKEYKSPN